MTRGMTGVDGTEKETETATEEMIVAGTIRLLLLPFLSSIVHYSRVQLNSPSIHCLMSLFCLTLVLNLHFRDSDRGRDDRRGGPDRYSERDRDGGRERSDRGRERSRDRDK